MFGFTPGRSSNLQIEIRGRPTSSKGPDSKCSRLCGHMILVANCCCRGEASIDNTETSEHGCVPVQLCVRTWTLELHITFSSQNITLLLILFSAIWLKANGRMVFLPFLAHGLHRNWWQITFGLWAIVCQPLINIIDPKLLMLFQRIQESKWSWSFHTSNSLSSRSFSTCLETVNLNYTSYVSWTKAAASSGLLWDLWGPSLISETLRAKDARSATASGLEVMRTITWWQLWGSVKGAQP